MTEKKTESTKEYVVVFDQVGVPTGEVVGQPPLAVSETFLRGDTISLSDADAKRHLDSGAVIAKSDKRANLVKANEPTGGGVKREIMDPVLLDQAEPAQAGDGGAVRTTGTPLGSKTALEKRSVKELKQLAAEHGVEVGPKDNKRSLAAKLAQVPAGETGAGADETVNPGQGDDQSPPPEAQPDESPE